MKILHVMAGAQHGGAETFFVDALTALAEMEDVQLSAVIRPNSESRTKILDDLKLPVQTASFNRYWPFSTRRAVRERNQAFQPDIAQYWMGRAGEFSVPPVKPEGRVIAWYGGYYKPERFKSGQFHVAVTQDIADHIVRQGVPKERVFVQHTYAEFSPSAPTSRAKFDTPEDAPLLLSLARLHWKKGLDVLLKSLQDVPEAYLWIAGDGPLEKELKKLCSDLGLDDRVRFLGWQNDRGALLAAADICVFPSRYEPFGTVTVEAWGTNVPLIAARAAGPAAFIKTEEDGLLVDIDDVEGLSQAINRVINEPDLKKKLVAGGKKSYEEGFSKEVFKTKARALYQKILETPLD